MIMCRLVNQLDLFPDPVSILCQSLRIMVYTPFMALTPKNKLKPTGGALWKSQKQLVFIFSITRPTPKKNTIKTSEFVLSKFSARFGDRDLSSISQEEVLDFLMSLTKDNKQATKRNRYSVLSSFYNFSINSALPALTNPCNTPVIRKIFKRPQAIQWQIVDKETVDEIIFQTMNPRNRLMIELMARGGMRIGEVLNLTPCDIQESFLTIQNPKSGRPEETVYVPRKILVRLTGYVKTKDITNNDRIFPISYVAAWTMVKKAGKLVNIELRPHDLRRHAATYASRSGTPIEIVSKVILRHSDLSTTQRYLGKVNVSEAIRWIETLYGWLGKNTDGEALPGLPRDCFRDNVFIMRNIRRALHPVHLKLQVIFVSPSSLGS